MVSLRHKLIIPLCWPAILLAVHAEADDPLSSLRLHQIRAAKLQPIIQLIEPIVPKERLSVVPASRQIAIFATDSVHELVAEKIAAFEEDAVLLQRIKLAKLDPKEVERVVYSLQESSRQKEAKPQNAEPPDSQLRLEVDARAGRLLVWGKQTEIELVQRAIAELKKRPSNKPVPARSTPLASTGKPAKETKRSSVQTTGRNSLRAPRGPIRIVHVKGADILLIRGQGDDVDELFGDQTKDRER